MPPIDHHRPLHPWCLPVNHNRTPYHVQLCHHHPCYLHRTASPPPIPMTIHSHHGGINQSTHGGGGLHHSPQSGVYHSPHGNIVTRSHPGCTSHHGGTSLHGGASIHGGTSHNGWNHSHHGSTSLHISNSQPLITRKKPHTMVPHTMAASNTMAAPHTMLIYLGGDSPFHGGFHGCHLPPSTIQSLGRHRPSAMVRSTPVLAKSGHQSPHHQSLPPSIPGIQRSTS
jgi:hypothetical protein